MNEIRPSTSTRSSWTKGELTRGRRAESGEHVGEETPCLRGRRLGRMGVGHLDGQPQVRQDLADDVGVVDGGDAFF